jgi:helix-turn-helix, Psq domain.
VGGIATKAAVRKYSIPRSTLQCKVISKYSKSFMGLVLILSEDEEQIVVK